jgi:hypothetical protein
VQTLAGYGGGAETRAYETTPNFGNGGGGYLDSSDTYMAATVIDGTAGTISYYVFRASDGAGGLQQTIPAISLSSYSFTNAYLGRSAYDGDPIPIGTIDEFKIYDEARSASQILGDFNAGPTGGDGPKVVIDRETGSMTMSAGTSGQIFRYTLNSASGALNTANIGVAQTLDANYNGGDGTFDPDDAWVVVSSAATSITEEDSIGEGADDGGSLDSVPVGTADAWFRYHQEDVWALVQVFDGSGFTTIEIPVEFTGNGGDAYERSDLNFDGEIDLLDWNNEFRPNHLGAISPTLSDAASYAFGDLDGDQDNDFFDFRIFQADFDAANGAGALAALMAVPEPGSALLWGVGLAAAWATVRRKKLAANR